MIEKKLGGAVVYKRKNGGIEFALVHDVFGYWTLSKGRIEEGERFGWSQRNSGRDRFGCGGRQRAGQKRICRFRPGKRQNKKKASLYFLASVKTTI